MKPIPIATAKRIAKAYGYDQIIVYGRKVGGVHDAGEHLTTYGVDRKHCDAAARIGNYLKYNVFGWEPKK